MTDRQALLAALQHGDSFFPSGATSYSWGLETLSAAGRVADADDLADFIGGQIAGRWSSCDRAVVVAAHRAGGDLDEVERIDRLLDAQTLAREMREGSRNVGRALLKVHAGLGTARAADYQDRVRAGAPGHATAMQGFLWRAAGIGEADAETMSAQSLATGFVSAAVRLGVIGHLDAQRTLGALAEVISTVLAGPAPGIDEIGAFAPEAEIAILRHEAEGTRLFGN